MKNRDDWTTKDKWVIAGLILLCVVMAFFVGTGITTVFKYFVS